MGEGETKDLGNGVRKKSSRVEMDTITIKKNIKSIKGDYGGYQLWGKRGGG